MLDHNAIRARESAKRSADIDKHLEQSVFCISTTLGAAVKILKQETLADEDELRAQIDARCRPGVEKAYTSRAMGRSARIDENGKSWPVFSQFNFDDLDA